MTSKHENDTGKICSESKALKLAKSITLEPYNTMLKGLIQPQTDLMHAETVAKMG